MQELVLVLGSVAGACTAIAMDRIPKRKNNKLIFRANPVIRNQIQSLKIEKEILTKTISRLYQQDSDLTKIQRDKLLLRYQHQLGLMIAKIEKLEDASKHPDLGPLGDGLIMLMDQKLSQLDQKLYEISSKITTPPTQQMKQSESVKEIVHEKPVMKKIEAKTEIQKADESYTPPIEVLAEPHKSVELITLTEIPNKMPEFPAELVRSNITTQKQIEQVVVNTTIQTEKPKNREVQAVIEIPRAESSQPPDEKKIQIPVAVKIPEDEKLDDDDKDIDKIKSEIMKALSKLEQVEVE
ncbi:MAG: hypothetical protein ACT4N1_05880 [Nitrososphaerota archaeon]